MSPKPSVAAVMITGKDPARAWLAQRALQAYREQSWPRRSLIVVTDGFSPCESLVPAESTIQPRTDKEQLHFWADKILEVRVSGPHSLGELRNIGLRYATMHEFAIQWDDDDWHHSQRIEYQMAGITNGHCTLLQNQIRFDFIANVAFNKRWRPGKTAGIPGTILHSTTALTADYRLLGKAEDDWFIHDNFRNRCTVLDNSLRPELYVRFSHGANTWDRQHIMSGISPTIRNSWFLSQPQVDYLRTVLRRYAREDLADLAKIQPPF